MPYSYDPATLKFIHHKSDDKGQMRIAAEKMDGEFVDGVVVKEMYLSQDSLPVFIEYLQRCVRTEEKPSLFDIARKMAKK